MPSPNNRGDAHSGNRDSDAALRDFTRAIELAPDLFLFYLNRANIFRDKRDFQAALDDFAQQVRKAQAECNSAVIARYADAAGLREVVGERIYDRLTETAKIVVFDGESFRARARQEHSI